MRHLYLKLIFFCIVVLVYSSSIDEKVKQYFRNDVFKAFQKHWQAHRKSFENAILLALKENYGYRGMNVYVRRSADSLKLCTGFYGTDNVIELLLIDMTLTGLPHLTMPEVTFALASNVLRVEAGLSKMIMEAEYTLFRNQSDIEYSAIDKTLEKSPFSYQQVQPHGQLAVIAEDCTLDGFIIAKLSGHLVNLGHDTFRVTNCKFHVEISSYRQGEPPVIAPYFSIEQGMYASGVVDASMSINIKLMIQMSDKHQVNFITIHHALYNNKLVQENIVRKPVYVKTIPECSLPNSCLKSSSVVDLLERKQLELMLTKPIRAELLPKLQAAVFTYINTSLIFGDYLPKFREYQNNIFKESLKHMNKIVWEINKETVKGNHVTMSLEPSEVSWTSTKICSGESCYGHILVDNVTVYGLDTLYSSHTGGPYKLQSPRIAEAMRFHSLMVRGSLLFVNNSIQRNHDFVAEIHDVSVEFEIDVDKSEPRIEVVNWRSFEFSIIELENHQESQKDLDAFIQGYLINKLSILLKDHIISTYHKWFDKIHKLAVAAPNSTICINVNNNDGQN